LVGRGSEVELDGGCLRGSGGLGGDAVEEGQAGQDAMDGIGVVAGGADQVPYPDDVEASLLLGVRVFDDMNVGLEGKVCDIGDLAKLVDAGALVFEVEAGVLLGGGRLDDGLADLADLLMGVDLWRVRVR
jgi:hypothetical protein